MKIKNIVIAAALAITASGAFAEADSYLYWMVGNNVNLISGQPTPFDYATVKLDEEYLYPYSGDTQLPQRGISANESGGTAAAYWGMFSEGDTFLFELWDYVDGVNDVMTGYREISYSSLASYIRTVGTQASPSASPYVLNGVIPEPTSGLLSLFGLAALVLRRKRMA